MLSWRLYSYLAAIFLPLKNDVLEIATDDADVLTLGSVLVPATLIGTYLNLVVGNITSGVFGGMGRPLISTILSFGLELPLSIGGVALLILHFNANLLAVTWFQAISGGLEAVLVLGIMFMSDWTKCADEARARQESTPAAADDDDVGGTGPDGTDEVNVYETADLLEGQSGGNVNEPEEE